MSHLIHVETAVMRADGELVEEFVEGVEKIVSGQVRINPCGDVILTSTHGGGPGQRLSPDVRRTLRSAPRFHPRWYRAMIRSLEGECDRTRDR